MRMTSFVCDHASVKWILSISLIPNMWMCENDVVQQKQLFAYRYAWTNRLTVHSGLLVLVQSTCPVENMIQEHYSRMPTSYARGRQVTVQSTLVYIECIGVPGIKIDYFLIEINTKEVKKYLENYDYLDAVFLEQINQWNNQSINHLINQSINQ